MVYHVGSPAMFEGNRFLPETGTPIWKIVRSRTVLALCDPEPLAVATCMLKSLTMGLRSGASAEPCTAISVVAIDTPSAVAPLYKVGGGVAFIIGQSCASANYRVAIRMYWKDSESRDATNPTAIEELNCCPLDRLVILRHVTEFLVTGVQQLLEWQLLQFTQVLYESFGQSCGGGIVVVVCASRRLRDHLVAESHFEVVFRRDAQGGCCDVFFAGVAPHDGRATLRRDHGIN